MLATSEGIGLLPAFLGRITDPAVQQPDLDVWWHGPGLSVRGTTDATWEQAITFVGDLKPAGAEKASRKTHHSLLGIRGSGDFDWLTESRRANCHF
jgi:hypothetical protein